MRIVAVTAQIDIRRAGQDIVAASKGAVDQSLTVQPGIQRAGLSRQHIDGQLAQRRADAVKKELVKRYGIDANRVNAEGQGIGSLFQENSWNRVAVCTVNE